MFLLEKYAREGDTDGLAALERALAIASVVQRPLTLIMADVDHFASINDEHGHAAGDEVLKAVADTLSRAFPCRSDVVARYGGDKLAIILPDAGEAEAALLAARVLNAVRALRVKLASGRTLAVTVSAGAAVARENESAAELIERAEGALSRSKRAGRNRWCAASSRVH